MIGLPAILATSIFTLPPSLNVSRSRDLIAVTGLSNTSSIEPVGDMLAVRESKATTLRPSRFVNSSGRRFDVIKQLVRRIAETTSATTDHLPIIPPVGWTSTLYVVRWGSLISRDY